MVDNSCNVFENDFIYRLRPATSLTMDELKNHYLWFSKPKGFKDVNDANIGAFMKNTKQLYDVAKMRMSKHGVDELCGLMKDTGICCFTKTMVSKNERCHFPNGKSPSILVAYNRKMLEDFWVNHPKYPQGDCFKDVLYVQNPLVLNEYGEYDILVSKTEYGEKYETFCSLTSSEKGWDKLMFLLLTRLDVKFAKQNEARIILGGRSLEYLDLTSKGYKFEIPKESISSVYYYEDTPVDFFEQLKGLGINIEKI